MPKVRAQVLEFVAAHPGVHGREVERRLGLSSRLAAYHLDLLEEAGQVQRVQEAGFARFFPSVGRPKWSARDVAFLCLMRRPVALRATLLLLSRGPTAPGDVARDLAIPRASATYHLQQLLQAGIVASRRDGRNVELRLADPDYVRGMLANFTPLPDDLEAFEAMWNDLFS